MPEALIAWLGPVCAVLGIALVAGYLLRVPGQRRRADDYALWLRRGARAFGHSVAAERFGVVGLRLTIDPAQPPYTRAQLTLVQEPRELVVIWLWHRLRGYHDALVLHGELLTPPLRDLDLYDPLALRDVAQTIRRDGWPEEPWPDSRWRLSGNTPGLAEAVTPILELLGPHAQLLRRLSLRRTGVHVLLQMDLPGPGLPNPDQFFTLLAQRLPALVSETR